MWWCRPPAPGATASGAAPMPRAAASRPALAVTATSGSAPVTGGAHSAIRAAGAVVKPLGTPAVLLVGVPGATKASSPEAAWPARSASSDAAACSGVSVQSSADHDDAVEAVGEAAEVEIGVAHGDEHPGVTGRVGVDGPLERVLDLGQPARPARRGRRRAAPLTGRGSVRRRGDRAPVMTRRGTPRNRSGSRWRPTAPAGTSLRRHAVHVASRWAVAGKVGAPPGASVRFVGRQRVDEVPGPAGRDPTGHGLPRRLGSGRVVRCRPPLVPVPLAGGPLVVGEPGLVGIEVHLVGEDADVQRLVLLGVSSLDPHGQQRDRHRAVERLDRGLGVDVGHHTSGPTTRWRAWTSTWTGFWKSASAVMALSSGFGCRPLAVATRPRSATVNGVPGAMSRVGPGRGPPVRDRAGGAVRRRRLVEPEARLGDLLLEGEEPAVARREVLLR